MMKVTSKLKEATFLLAILGGASCAGAIGDSSDTDSTQPGAGGNGSGGAGGFVNGMGGNPAKASVSVARRLSIREYNNVIAALLYDTSTPLILADDARTPFDNDATTDVQKPSRSLIDSLWTTASDAAASLLADKTRLAKLMSSVGCMPAETDIDGNCFQQFLARFGRRALRREMAKNEINSYMELLSFAQEDKSFYSAIGAAVRMFLEMPEFIYRVEVDESRPVRGQGGVFQLSGYEMASRLSFLFWGRGPDDALLDLAKNGVLDAPRGIESTVDMMLKSPDARQTISILHAMWFNYDGGITQDMRTQTEALLDRVIFEDQKPWPELLRADKTYVNMDLANRYGLEIPAQSQAALAAKKTNFAWLPWTGNRMGLLSEGAFLAIARATNEENLVIRRGQHVREGLLCKPRLLKPDKVPPAQTKPAGHCKWDVMANHRSAGACKGCHQEMDPIGFGLDAYDGTGKKRQWDVVDDFIHLRFPSLKVGTALTDCPKSAHPGELEGETFSGPGELAQVLLKSPLLNACVAQQVYQFAVGRSLDDNDRAFTANLADGAGASPFLQMVKSMASSDVFRSRRRAN